MNNSTFTMTNAIATKIFDDEKFRDSFINLYYRWQDESAYEDINEYRNYLNGIIQNVTGIADLQIAKMTGRPFKITIKCDYEFTLKNGEKRIHPAHVMYSFNSKGSYEMNIKPIK